MLICVGKTLSAFQIAMTSVLEQKAITSSPHPVPPFYKRHTDHQIQYAPCTKVIPTQELVGYLKGLELLNFTTTWKPPAHRAIHNVAIHMLSEYQDER